MGPEVLRGYGPSQILEKTAKEDPMANTASLLSRRQVAAILKLTEAQVRADDNVVFHPTKAPDGSWKYAPEEVAAVLHGGVDGDTAGDASGAVCAAAFALFRAGKALADAVIELKQPPAVIRRLRAEYDLMAGCLTLDRSTLEALAKVLRGQPRDQANLVEMVAALSERVRVEHERGYAAGLTEATDLGEIVDPATGKCRPLGSEEAALAVRSVAEHWASTGDTLKKTL
jgi:hypothetical protein